MGSMRRAWAAIEAAVSGIGNRGLTGANEALDIIAGSPDRRIAGSPDRRIAGSPDRRIAGSPDRRIAGSPDRRIAGSPDRRIAGSPDRRIAGSPDRRIAGSPDRPTCVRGLGGESVRRMAALAPVSSIPVSKPSRSAARGPGACRRSSSCGGPVASSARSGRFGGAAVGVRLSILALTCLLLAGLSSQAYAQRVDRTGCPNVNLYPGEIAKNEIDPLMAAYKAAAEELRKDGIGYITKTGPAFTAAKTAGEALLAGMRSVRNRIRSFGNTEVGAPHYNVAFQWQLDLANLLGVSRRLNIHTGLRQVANDIKYDARRCEGITRSH